MAKVPCTHCHLEFDESSMIVEQENDRTLYFCCNGCQGVYHLLKEEGLDSFYDKVGNTALHPATPKATDDLQKYDLEGFRRKYIKERDDGLYEIHLIIEGIHCSACVWLNEKVLHRKEGIVEATINYTNNKAKVVWDPDIVKLSEIVDTIRSIGYNAYPYDPTLQEERAVKTRKSYYMRILVAVFGSMNIMWLAIAKYAGYFSGIQTEYKNILEIAEFALATPVLFYSGWIFFKGAYYGLKNRFVNMDVLVAVGATLTYLYSIYALFSGKGEVYFDSVAMIITFILVGKYLEVLSKKQAVDTIDTLMGTVPTEVTVVSEDGSKALVSVENVAVGDTIELKPGEKAVIDGTILGGEASFDESALTGESEPVFKRPGDTILSGSVCLDSTIRYRAEKEAAASLLHTIVTLLEEAVTKKPHIQKLADTVSGYFSVTILLIAIATFIGWWLSKGDFETALIVAISVIVIACPCALGLATPMATLVGIGVAAKRNILFKEAEYLETMAKGDLLALDKTGTVTQGRPDVVDAIYYEDFDEALLRALLHSSDHPVAKGVLRYLEKSTTDKTPLPTLTDIKSIQARGIRAQYDDTTLLGGNAAMMRENDLACDETGEESLFFFAIDGRIVARFALRDRLREEAAEVIAAFKRRGIRVVMLTGDRPESAKRIAEEAGIDEVHARLLPQEKADFIAEAQSKGDVVIMAGDGINDAVALARADIAIAMGGGTDIAIDVSDVVLLDDRLSELLAAYRISRRTFRAVKENLGLSLLYNLIAVPVAVAGYVTPFIAALSMSLSSLIVVGNSLRIKRLERTLDNA